MSLNGLTAARLYDEHLDAVYAYAARRVGPEIAVDVVKEVFDHALARERPPQTGSDLGWLLALTTAFLRRHSETECRRLRSWTPEPKVSDHLVPRQTDPLLEDAGDDVGAVTTAHVMSALADLDPVDRDLVFLVAWEHCSSSLAAVATGIPAGEVRQRLAGIRREIRRRVDELSVEPLDLSNHSISEVPAYKPLPPDDPDRPMPKFDPGDDGNSEPRPEISHEPGPEASA